MHVAVVILNWNGKKFLEQFLPALVKYSGDDAELIVADNASTDDSIQFLRTNYPAIRIIENPRNLGFPGGYNAALDKVSADYYILLNSDIEVTPNWILPVIGMMDKDQSIAACQPRILSWYEKNRFEYAGAAGGFIDLYGYPFCRGRLFLELEEDHGQYNDPVEIFWASGACMFVRADVFHKLGGLDEDFFAHMEEIDFCWRLQNEGFRVMYCPGSTVYHIGGGTLPKRSSVKTYLNFRNNFILLYKNLPEEFLFRVFSRRLILDGIAAFKFLFTAGTGDFLAVIKAHFSFWALLRKTKAKRKQLKQGALRNVYRKNIVTEHFLKGKKYFSQLDQDGFYK